MPFEESEVSQAFRSFHDRGLGGTRPPAELVAGAVVVDDQIGQLIANRWRGTTVIAPSSIALISCSVERTSATRVGPKMPGTALTSTFNHRVDRRTVGSLEYFQPAS